MSTIGTLPPLDPTEPGSKPISMKPESAPMIEPPDGPAGTAVTAEVASVDKVVPATTPAMVAAMTWIYSGATLFSDGITAPAAISDTTDSQHALCACILTLTASPVTKKKGVALKMDTGIQQTKFPLMTMSAPSQCLSSSSQSPPFVWISIL